MILSLMRPLPSLDAFCTVGHWLNRLQCLCKASSIDVWVVVEVDCVLSSSKSTGPPSAKVGRLKFLVVKIR